MTRRIHFPRQADVIYERAKAYRRLSPTERLRALFDLIASGQTLMKHSPHREAGARLRQAHEAEWQRVQKELFARHGQ